MTVETSPAAIQANTYSAEIIRRMVASDLKRGSTIGSVQGGLIGAGDLALSLNGTTKLNVATGECWVPGTNAASTTQSGYYFRCSAAETLTPTANAGGTPRIDAIVARVKDKAYTGETEDKGELAVVAGTAKAATTLATLEGAPGQTGGPAMPNNCFVLGYVLMPSASGAITEFLNVAQPALITNGRLLTTGSNVTAANLDTIKATANITVTLPGTAGPAPAAPIAGAEVTIFANGHTVKLKPGSGTISGDFVVGASEIVLVGSQHVTVVSDGTNWLIVSGEPKREQTYTAEKSFTKAEGEAGFEPSATRLAFVVVKSTSSTGGAIIAAVGATTVLTMAGGAEGTTVSLMVPPGAKWKLNQSGTFSTFLL